MGVFNKYEEDGQVDNKSAETIIGPSVKVEGSFIGEANVLVEGEVIGNLKTKGNLTIAEGAKVEAEIEASNLLISGEVIGNIKCQGKLELTPSAKITGDVETNIISVQTGAMLQGRYSTNIGADKTIKNDSSEGKEDREEILDKKKKK